VIDTVWIFVCAFLVFIMQPGFMCLESGLTRSRNSINVAMKNVTDFCCSILVFWIVGYSLMYGKSYSGIAGWGDEGKNFGLEGSAIFIFQAMFCGTSVTILSGAIAERVKFLTYILIAIFVSSAIYPVVGHWVWNEDGWLAKLGFIDFAGATVVHVVGGWCALALLILIGPRRFRFNKFGRASRVYHSNLPMAMMGVMFLWLGWFGFSAGSNLSFDERVGTIIINTILATSSSLIASLIIERIFMGHYSARSVLNGVLAGLVSTTAACNILTPETSIILGVIASAVCFTAELVLLRFKIDDAVSAVPVHLFCGLLASLSAPVAYALHSDNQDILGMLAVQSLGNFSIGLYVFLTMYVFFKIVNRILPVRIDSKEEDVGLNISEHAQENEAYQLIQAMNRQKMGLSSKAKVNAFSDTGLIAMHYNDTIEHLEITKEKLERSKNQYEVLSKNSPVGIISVSVDGEIQYVNEKCDEILGISGQELIGLNVIDYQGQSHVLSSLQSLLSQLCEKKHISKQISIEINGELSKYIYVQSSQSYSADETISGFIMTFNDITDRVILEEKLKQSQKLESIGTMAAGVAHEINSPLQFINSNIAFVQNSFESLIDLQRMYTDMLADLGASVETNERKLDTDFLINEVPIALEQTMDGVNRVSKIIQSMKELVHPSSSEFGFCDVNRTIENSTVITRNEWKVAANIHLDLDESLPEAWCVESEMSQVFIVLIVNACHAIMEAKPDRKGDLKITSKLENNFIQVKFLDNGPGIPEDVIGRIFDPFFTTKDVGKGSGQGLSIAHRIITDGHKGEILVKSKVGKGTLFIVNIPIQKR